MSRRFKRRNWKQIGIVCLLAITIITAGMAVYINHEWKNCEKKINILEEQLESYQRLVYVATEKIPRGTVLTEENVRQEIRYSDLPQEIYATEASLGSNVAQDVEAGVCITFSMLCTEEENVREVYVTAAELPEHIQAGDRVDVRIRYANAEDYIVLSDKSLLRCDRDRGMVLKLTEEEILLLSSAIADSDYFKDTQIYVVEYPEYEQQEGGRVNYVANMQILMMLGKEKTEGESRNALEQRLMQDGK